MQKFSPRPFQKPETGSETKAGDGRTVLGLLVSRKLCGENFCKSFPRAPFKNLKQRERQTPETGELCAKIHRAVKILICAARRISVPEKIKMCRARNKKQHVSFFIHTVHRTQNRIFVWVCLSFRTSAKHPAPGSPASEAKHAQTRTLAPFFGSMLCTKHEIACPVPVFPSFRTLAKHPAPGSPASNAKRAQSPASVHRFQEHSMQPCFAGKTFAKVFPRPFQKSETGSETKAGAGRTVLGLLVSRKLCAETVCKSFPRAPFKICTKRRAGQSRLCG